MHGSRTWAELSTLHNPAAKGPEPTPVALRRLEVGNQPVCQTGGLRYSIPSTAGEYPGDTARMIGQMSGADEDRVDPVASTQQGANPPSGCGRSRGALPATHGRTAGRAHRESRPAFEQRASPEPCDSQHPRPPRQPGFHRHGRHNPARGSAPGQAPQQAQPAPPVDVAGPSPAGVPAATHG